MAAKMRTAQTVFLLLLLWTEAASFAIPSQRRSILSSTYDGRSFSLYGQKDRDESEPALKSEGTASPSNKEWRTTIFPAKLEQALDGPPEEDFVRQEVIQVLAGFIGAFSGVAVSYFKISINALRDLCYGDFSDFFPYVLVPALGGLAVALLAGGDFPPGLKGVVTETDANSLKYGSVDEEESSVSNVLNPALRYIRKSLAAVATLGTGCSLGPEGPSVELSMAISRLGMLIWPFETTDVATRVRRNRLFLACGAAAGVSSGFNAPLSGVFFALEVVQGALPRKVLLPENDDDDASSNKVLRQESLTTDRGSISAILISSVISALVTRSILGNELALRLTSFDLKSPIGELPLFLVLGVLSGLTAVVFSQSAKLSKAVFDGEAGPAWFRESIETMPAWYKPVIGGWINGAVGIFYPQILFFGYLTLNQLLKNDNLSVGVLLQLLGAKVFTTAVSAGSGLVGGTFAPSLFMGGMLGGAFHNVVQDTLVSLNVSTDVITATGAYASVGAASVLASLFKAPLTASLVLFELTRDYDVLVPLVVSAGIGSLVSDVVEEKIESLLDVETAKASSETKTS